MALSSTVSPASGRRRFGYLATLVVDGALLGLLVRWPGWDTVPFLTEETGDVLGWLIAALVAGIVVNAVYLIADPPPLKAIGEVVSDAITLVALIRLWQVFPFDFADESTVPWTTLTRTVLIVAIAGTVLALVVTVVRFVRHALVDRSTTEPTSASDR
ncbi:MULTISPECIES: hypothetical protein [unclassified Gordonia (in: high G+C Gram-positive bacteria)]|uniref:hypothetical protein n=1 Tax=Gordonia TaxID=2053 RepID=UPI00071D90C8|nr:MULTISPECIES: hypothetical protein [unclassified Gordonia (in: high G+C Gram-positive bacteria)]KSU58225.1 hypothetical protein AS181_12075 [Gordonia sp. SGD-V-85]MBR7194750.1 hypothetical protein [Gordonia sp. SCSIO 19800]MCX2753638.1 hypothetical protein [Gordonia sp. 4N]MDT0223232.1 hypothetical protein [Gordonia sp. AC31]SCC27679.1 hypothetical protein GA0061091_108175 [Gordonia sp. v-85]